MLLSFLWSLSSASSRRELALYQCNPAAFDRSSWDASRSGGMSQQQCPHLLFQFPQYQEKVQESPTQIGKTWWLVTSFSIAMFNLVILVFRLFGLGYLWLRSSIWSRSGLFCLWWNHWHMFPDFILGFHACKTGTVHHPTSNMKHQMTQAKHTASSSADIHLCTGLHAICINNANHARAAFQNDLRNWKLKFLCLFLIFFGHCDIVEFLRYWRSKYSTNIEPARQAKLVDAKWEMSPCSAHVDRQEQPRI